MSKTKQAFENFIADLSEKSGYGYCELVDLWNSYEQDVYEDGEDIDIDYFVGVTMERDW